jgi:hypothetical protein
MSIHHAIVKSAASKGVILTSDAETVSAREAVSGAIITVNIDDHDSENEAAKEAWATVADMALWNAEQADGLAIWQDQEDLTYAVVIRTPEGDEPVEVGFDSLADAIEGAEAAETGEQAEDEEAEEDHGSVVPGSFKALYAEIGVRKQDNGDEMVRVFANHTLILDGKREVIDPEKVEALASRNGVEYPVSGYGPAITGTRGWEGRYRMTVGNIMRKRIADAGVIIVPASLNNGTEVTHALSQAFCDKHRTKPRMSKKAKAEAAKAEADIAS